MAKYYNADTLLEFVKNNTPTINGHTTMKCVERAIKEAPTADVKEVKRGKWIEHFKNNVWHYDCPFCDDGYVVKERDENVPNYCHNCGAKMDGRKENE